MHLQGHRQAGISVLPGVLWGNRTLRQVDRNKKPGQFKKFQHLNVANHVRVYLFVSPELIFVRLPLSRMWAECADIDRICINAPFLFTDQNGEMKFDNFPDPSRILAKGLT